MDNYVSGVGVERIDPVWGRHHGSWRMSCLAGPSLMRPAGWTDTSIRGSKSPKGPAVAVPGALADDFVDQEAVWGGAIGVDYAEDRRAFSADAATSSYSVTINRSLGKVRP
jgi:hypothetical protein